MEVKNKTNNTQSGEYMRTVISYSGPFDAQVLSVIAENIEYSLSNNPRVSRKIFKIFIELAQNISFYSYERQRTEEKAMFGSGVLLLREYKDYYSFSTGNMVANTAVLPLLQKCEAINILDREKLRQYKRKLRNMPAGITGGGNIGLVQVALTADYPLEYNIRKIDTHQSFYILSIKVNKE